MQSHIHHQGQGHQCLHGNLKNKVKQFSFLSSFSLASRNVGEHCKFLLLYISYPKVNKLINLRDFAHPINSVKHWFSTAASRVQSLCQHAGWSWLPRWTHLFVSSKFLVHAQASCSSIDQTFPLKIEGRDRCKLCVLYGSSCCYKVYVCRPEYIEKRRQCKREIERDPKMFTKSLYVPAETCTPRCRIEMGGTVHMETVLEFAVITCLHLTLAYCRFCWVTCFLYYHLPRSMIAGCSCVNDWFTCFHSFLYLW